MQVLGLRELPFTLISGLGEKHVWDGLAWSSHFSACTSYDFTYSILLGSEALRGGFVKGHTSRCNVELGWEVRFSALALWGEWPSLEGRHFSCGEDWLPGQGLAHGWEREGAWYRQTCHCNSSFCGEAGSHSLRGPGTACLPLGPSLRPPSLLPSLQILRQADSAIRRPAASA